MAPVLEKRETTTQSTLENDHQIWCSVNNTSAWYIHLVKFPFKPFLIRPYFAYCNCATLTVTVVTVANNHVWVPNRALGRRIHLYGAHLHVKKPAWHSLCRLCHCYFLFQRELEFHAIWIQIARLGSTLVLKGLFYTWNSHINTELAGRLNHTTRWSVDTLPRSVV